MENLRQLQDNYWEQATSSTSDAKNTINAKNGLWDGLFSPEDEPANIFEQFVDNKIVNGQGIPDAIVDNENGSDINSTISTIDEAIGNLSLSSLPSRSSDGALQQQKISGSFMDSFSSQPSSSKSKVTTKSQISSNSLESQSQAASDVTVHLDYARLKSEHRKLKKYFENAYGNRYKTPPVTETIKRLYRSEPVALDFYKTRQEKMELLDASLDLDDWDVVVTVLLFLKRTLDNSLFRQCLLERPAAARHYVTYLRESGEKQELMDTLFGLGRITDAAMVELEQAYSCKDPKKQLESLRNCLIGGFQHPDLANERRHLEEWIGILEMHANARH